MQPRRSRRISLAVLEHRKSKKEAVDDDVDCEENSFHENLTDNEDDLLEKGILKEEEIKEHESKKRKDNEAVSVNDAQPSKKRRLHGDRNSHVPGATKSLPPPSSAEEENSSSESNKKVLEKMTKINVPNFFTL